MKKAFTLIEVCLVMMIFGVAVTALMALFPFSLRQGNLAASDMVVTTFGDMILNDIQANASLQPWNTWSAENAFAAAVMRGVRIDTGEGPGTGQALTPSAGGDSYEGSVDEYLGLKKTFIKCRVTFTKVTEYGGRLYRVTLWVTDNRVAAMTSGTVFVTYLFYFGEVP